jgi:chromosome segregation ATPase
MYIHPSWLTGCSEKYFKTLTGNRDVEDSLERLDKLTQEEARMASAEQLKMMHSIDGRVMGVDDRVRGVEGQVQGVRGGVQGVRDDVQEARDDVREVRDDVQDVGNKVQDARGDMRDVGDKVQIVDDRVQDIGNKIQDVDDRVQAIDSNVRGLDDKLDQANRSLYFQTLITIPRAQTASQGTNSEIVSYDGFRPQIHPPIITLHAKPITTAQLNGFSKEVYSISGNLLAPSCGYTENVCYS